MTTVIRSKEIQMVSIASIVPNPKNTNKHPKEQIERLVKIIEFQGFRDPLVISNQSGFLVEGHGRLEAAKIMGMEKLPVIYQDFDTPAMEFAAMTASNEIARWASLDMNMVLENLESLGDMDTDLLGLKELKIPAKFDPQADQDAVPEIVPTRAKKGEVWSLGRHRLCVGDSTMIDDVKKLMGGALADLLLTDPPYNVAYEGKTKDAMKIENDSMGNEDFRKFLVDVFTNADMFMRPGASFYIWHADSEGYNFRGACFDAGWKIRQCLIWVKQTLVMGRQDYHWKHEPCLYGWKEGAAHKWASDRKQTTCLEFNKPSRNGEHPTMKPVELFEYQMLNNTDRGDLVLDLFLGSGTSIIAAEKNDRVCYGMEFDPKYADVILARWEAFTGLKATLESYYGTKT